MIDARQSLFGGPANPPCILDSILSSVRRQPDAAAVVDAGRTYTYAELLAWVQALDATLAEHGVGVNDRVAVTGERSAATIATFLTVMARGAMYVPLDPEYPVKRLAHMLDDSGASVLMYNGERPACESSAVPVPVPGFDACAPRSAGPGVQWQRCPCEPDLPIYAIYTSGSTGWPKGVAIAHRCLDNMAEWQRRHSPRPNLRTGQFAPLNFDVYFQEVLASLCGGGTVIIVPERLRRDPITLLPWLAEHRVERLFMPYVALQMLAVAASSEPSLDHLSLVEVNTAGEQLVCTPQIREFFARLGECRLVNHYGQSESAMVTSHILTGPSIDWPALPPVGIPLPGCEALVDATDPAEPAVGELLVAGLPVSLGYLNQPAMNAARYIHIDQTPQGNTTVFRTGDLVRIEGGVVHFLTRIDDEVKIRGVRVNLLEIDVWLLDQPGVTSAVAVVAETGSGLRTLRAAVTCEGPTSGPDVATMLARLAEVLPEVSVPRSISVLTEMPRTPSGKIDRDAVAELVADDVERRQVVQRRRCSPSITAGPYGV